MSARLWHLLGRATYPPGLWSGPYWWRSLNAWWLGWWGWAFFYTDPWRPGRLSQVSAVVCQRCERGAEACNYCENIAEVDWEAICDCGLYDFGYHLVDCESRADFRYVIACSYEEAELPR